MVLRARNIRKVALPATLAIGLGAGSLVLASPPAHAATTLTRYVHTGSATLNVRQGPGSSYTSVGALASGAKLVGYQSGSWLRITRGPYTGGYVSLGWLTTKAPTKAPGTPGRSITAWVTTDDQYANIRATASFSGKVVGHYTHHAKIVGSVVGNGPWVKTGKGYVNSGSLEVFTSNPSKVNGKIPTALLCGVPLAYNAKHSFAPGYTVNTRRYLNCSALAALNSLQVAFKKAFGHYATIDLTYRSYAEQQYWWKKYGYPRAAYPGTSNHGYGVAIDFEEDDQPNIYSWGHAANKWLLAHGGAYGFNNPFAATKQKGEDYHFNFIG